MHKTKPAKIIYIIIILFSVALAEQKNTSLFFPNMGIEIGCGHNTLNWKESSNILCPGGSKVNRNKLYLTPNFRISYQSEIFYNLFTRLFMGHTQFGGKSKQDQYAFSAYEYGIQTQFKKSNFAFGPGYKLNQLLDVHFKLPIMNDKRNNWFDRYTHNAGFRASYLYKKLSFGTEFWFGIKNFSKVGGKVYENQYRIMIGYYFIP